MTKSIRIPEPEPIKGMMHEECDFVRDEIDRLDDLLNQIPKENKLERIGFEHRLNLAETLLQSMGSNLDKFENIVLRASIFAFLKHRGQVDDCGKPYYESHIRQVYSIIKEVTYDPEILAAALLHDTLEDTQTTHQELVQEFGQRVADLVHEVTHEGKKDEKGFYFPRLKSKDAILIKFADRLSNLSSMESWAPDRQEHYLKKSKFWKSE